MFGWSNSRFRYTHTHTSRPFLATAYLFPIQHETQSPAHSRVHFDFLLALSVNEHTNVKAFENQRPALVLYIILYLCMWVLFFFIRCSYQSRSRSLRRKVATILLWLRMRFFRFITGNCDGRINSIFSAHPLLSFLGRFCFIVVALLMKCEIAKELWEICYNEKLQTTVHYNDYLHVFST